MPIPPRSIPDPTPGTYSGLDALRHTVMVKSRDASTAVELRESEAPLPLSMTLFFRSGDGSPLGMTFTFVGLTVDNLLARCPL